MKQLNKREEDKENINPLKIIPQTRTFAKNAADFNKGIEKINKSTQAYEKLKVFYRKILKLLGRDANSDKIRAMIDQVKNVRNF